MTGSRTWHDTDRIEKALRKVRYDAGSPPWEDMILVHGKASGADKQADNIARRFGMQREPHPAEWTRPDGTTDMGAGYKRNAHMVELGADYCLAFIQKCLGNNCTRLDEHGSHGAVHCSTLARKAGIKTRVYRENW